MAKVWSLPHVRGVPSLGVLRTIPTPTTGLCRTGCGSPTFRDALSLHAVCITPVEVNEGSGELIPFLHWQPSLFPREVGPHKIHFRGMLTVHSHYCLQSRSQVLHLLCLMGSKHSITLALAIIASWTNSPIPRVKPSFTRNVTASRGALGDAGYTPIGRCNTTTGVSPY